MITIIDEKEDYIIKINEIYKVLIKYRDRNEVSLMSGNSGIALFYVFYAALVDEKEPIEYANKLINNCFEDINNGFSNISFAGGISGFAWFLNFLMKNRFLDEEDFGFDGLYQYFYNSMMAYMKNGNYDYLHGALGVSLYLLNSKSLTKKRNAIIDLIEALERNGIEDFNDIKWISVIGETKQKVYNLSMSHGIASIISVLSKIYNSGIEKEKTKKLIYKAIGFLLSNKNTDYKHSIFPNYIHLNNSVSMKSRLAWCYGDLGIGMALLNSSIKLNDSELRESAVNILLHSAVRRDMKSNMVVDAGLCHGTAGIGHAFNKAYQYTNNKVFRETSRYWFSKTIELGHLSDGLAGYKTWRGPEYGGWQNDYSFLTGISGIGLSLISAISDIQPSWDECLLLS